MNILKKAPAMLEELKSYYGYLLEDALLEEIHQVSTLRDIPEGFSLIDIGERIQFMPLILSGVIKVMREDKQGDELLLYFLERGDTCTVSLSCCLGSQKSKIRAIADTPARLVAIPIQKMEEWIGTFQTWRHFVLNSYHDRMMELFETVDSLAFLDMEERLLKYLKDKARVTQDLMLHTTHQDIAYDMHTSRVVISRILKKLEKQGEIQLQRNQIRLLHL